MADPEQAPGGVLDLYAPDPVAAPAPPEVPAPRGALDLYSGVAVPDADRVPEAPGLPAWVEVVWTSFRREVRERYRPRAVIGEGGMGVVVEAHDRDMDRVVAIKGLRDPASVPEVQRRRQAREARLMARLTHPNILPVFDLWHDGAGNPWVSMLRVPGQVPTLARRLAELADAVEVERRPLSELLDVFLQVCRAVAHAHAIGVVHRDIKPENIFLGPSGEALLADWGVAQDASEGEAPAAVGTPGYAAPEQLSGEATPAPTADVYSLGVVLFALVAGRVATTGGSPAAPGTPLVVPARVPRELAAIILQATAFDPRQRYAGVGEMIRALDAYLGGGLIEGLGYSPAERLRKWARARPATAAALLTGGLALVALVGLQWRQARIQAGLLDRAQRNLAQALAEKASGALAARRLDRARHLAVLAVETAAQARSPAPPLAAALLAGAGRRGWARTRVARAGVLAMVADGPDRARLALGTGVVLDASLGEASDADRPDPIAGTSRGVPRLVVADSGGGAGLATADATGQVRLFAPGAPPRLLPGGLLEPRMLALDPRGERLFGAGAGPGVQVWDLSRPDDAPRTLGPASFRVTAAAFPGAATPATAPAVVAVGGEDGSLRLWDPARGSEKAALTGDGPVRRVRFDPGGVRLAWVSGDGPVRLWDVGAWVDGGRLEVPGGAATALDFSPDGTLLATGSAVGEVQLFDLASGELCGRLEGHRGPVTALDFEPAGRFLVSASEDGSVRTWEVEACRTAAGAPVGEAPPPALDSASPAWRAAFLARSPFRRRGDGLELELAP